MDEDQYEIVAASASQSTVYHSPKFLKILENVLEGSELVRLGVTSSSGVHAALPCFVKRTKIGNVLNSLPFYGSSGGVISVARTSDEGREAHKTLAEGFIELARENDCVTSTIISSPYDSMESTYVEDLEPDCVVDRIAQVLELPRRTESLMTSFAKKSRNSVRRAWREGVEVESGWTPKDLEDVFRGQEKIMRGLGVTPRPRAFFSEVESNMRGGEEYRVYRATRRGSTIALLLALYYRDIVEYSVPVVQDEYRRYAPMNAIVHTLASDAIEAGERKLSFGGTRSEQRELYRFKKSFGAVDEAYHYFTRIHGNVDNLRKMDEGSLLSTFKWFFVFPFQRKTTGSGGH